MIEALAADPTPYEDWGGLVRRLRSRMRNSGSTSDVRQQDASDHRRHRHVRERRPEAVPRHRHRRDPHLQPGREEAGGHAARLQQSRSCSSTSATSATTTASRRRCDGVDYVFHAAALKQVPSCEFYPLEALRTNALGAENVMRAIDDRGVERAIVLSTDKAVYPINAMGMSKAMMEKLMVAKAQLREAGRHHPVRHPLRQRHGVARLGHPAVHRAGQGAASRSPSPTRT